MRLSIRTQLGVLFMLSGLVAIAVISIACWVKVHNFVLNLRGQRLAQIATLKSTQLSLSLQIMDDTVKAITSRQWLRNALLQQVNGTATEQALNSTAQSLQDAIDGPSQQNLAIQAALWSASGNHSNPMQPLIDSTNPTIQNPQALFPYVNPSDSAMWLGQNDPTLPTALYPNLTYESRPGNLSMAFFNGRPLDAQSAVFLGPVSVNTTFTMFSITRAVTDASSPRVLGWLTILLDGRLILGVSQDSTALGNTGLNLMIGPNTEDNLFANVSETTPLWAQASTVQNQDVHFVLPPARNKSNSTEAQRPQARTSGTLPWNLASYPAASKAYLNNQNSMENSGSHLQDHDEEGYSVGVGFATPQSDLCDWIIMIEYTSKEIYEPIAQVRTLILICVFATLAALIVLVVPVTGIWAHPVRRLRAATAQSIAVYSDSESILQNIKSEKDEHSPSRLDRRGTGSSGRSWREHVFSIGRAEEENARLPAHQRKDIHKLTGAQTQFRIPPRVKERKVLACINDELSDLTKVFNQMIEELNQQYERLEERVAERTAELEQSKKAAEAANESKSLFIANISHELKTPLNGILGMTAVCMQEDDPARIKESLNIIYRSGDLLHNLLTDLLTFSKNQAGQALALEEKKFRLRDVATQIKAIFDNQARGNGVNLQMSFEGPSEPSGSGEKVSFEDNSDPLRNALLVGDQNRILQVVINLVGNALKFTPKNGNVWLRIRQLHEVPPRNQKFKDPWDSEEPKPATNGGPRETHDEDREHWNRRQRRKSSTNLDPIEGRVKKRQSVDSDAVDTSSYESLPPCWFEFEVEDTGPGIEKDIEAKIFEPFVQGDVSLARKHGGTGLGLSICSQLAKLMHGSIRVESEPGKGSTFFLKIPILFLGHVESTPRSSRSSSVASVPRPVKEESARTEAEIETKTSVLEPTPRSASIVSKLDKPRLLGFSQPFFTASTPPLASPSSENGPSGPRPKSSMRVLVAEDNDTNRKVVVRLLELEEVVNVVVARDGEEAFEKVKESIDTRTPFDLILMDVQMPRLDGRQSTKLIRQAGFTSPIVALTAFTDELNERECIESGMDFFIGKPIKKAEIKRILKRFSLDNVSASKSDQSSADGSAAPTPRKFSTGTRYSLEKRPSA